MPVRGVSTSRTWIFWSLLFPIGGKRGILAVPTEQWRESLATAIPLRKPCNSYQLVLSTMQWPINRSLESPEMLSATSEIGCNLMQHPKLDF